MIDMGMEMRTFKEEALQTTEVEDISQIQYSSF